MGSQVLDSTSYKTAAASCTNFVQMPSNRAAEVFESIIHRGEHGFEIWIRKPVAPRAKPVAQLPIEIEKPRQVYAESSAHILRIVRGEYLDRGKVDAAQAIRSSRGDYRKAQIPNHSNPPGSWPTV